MAQNVTAFIHASKAYPNIAGQPSLVLEKIVDQPILCTVIQACLDTPEVSQVVVVTSDNPDDVIISETVKEYYPEPHKSISIHSIPSAKEYSFVPQREKMYPVAFPYMWRPWYGLFTVSGYTEIAAYFNSDYCLIIDTCQCVTVTSDFLSQAVNQISEAGVSYGFNSPYRRLFALSTHFMNGVIERNKSRLKNDISQKGKKPLLDDIFTLESDFNNKQYKARNASLFKNNFFPALRKKEIDLLRHLSHLNLHNYRKAFERIRPQLSALFLEYLEIDLSNEQYGELSSGIVSKSIRNFAQTGCVLNFAGKTDPLQSERLAEYIAQAKEDGVSSVWVETQGECLSSEKIIELMQKGMDLLLIHANSFVDDLDTLQKILEAVNKERSEALYPFVALLVETSPWLSSEQEVMIQTFESLVDRIIIRSGNLGDQETGSSRTIDFSPNQRTICQQITNAAFIRGNEKIALCTMDATGYISAEEASPTLLSDELHRTIIEEQSNGDFGKSFGPCKKCNKWYIPNIKYGFSEVLLSKEYFASETVIELGDEDPSVAEKALNEMLEVFSAAYDLIQRESTLFEDVYRKSKRHLLARQIKRVINEVKTRAINILLYKEIFSKLYISLGEAYITQGKHEDALRVWENVLQVDPSNKYIHQRLDELLEMQISAQ